MAGQTKGGTLQIFKDDPSLLGHKKALMDRYGQYERLRSDIEKQEGSLRNFAEGYKVLGFNRREEEKMWTFVEWLPNAKKVFLVGEFNGWKTSHPLKDAGFGKWSIDLPDDAKGNLLVPHGSLLRLKIETQDGKEFDRVPAWAKQAVQDHSTNLFNGVFWEPPVAQRYVFKHGRPERPETLKIYEAHVGMASTDPKVATYLEFKDEVLPRIKRLGYTAVQLMAVAEHAYYGSFGYHVTSFFAPSSRSGSPEELKELVDAAHSMGIVVLMDLVHAHASSNQIDGIGAMDGTDYCYTHGGEKGKHAEWDSALFDYSKWEVMRFLLSNCRWWIEEYGFDGFRFDGVTSMLYKSHGIAKSFAGGYDDYFGGDLDMESCVYMMLANELIHDLLPSAVTVAEDVSGMPTLGRPVKEGGFGFDYRLSMALPDMWIKTLKELPDNAWNMGHLAHTLQNRRHGEGCIAYSESHDQSIVGDKSLAFRLIDKDMYTHMALSGPSSFLVDRGIALHKMIRLVTLGLGGEGYLNFMGAEFGHPEWVDFPREGNDWSYKHCLRRWDLADSADLRFKFMYLFDELMHQCDNRFKFASSQHQWCVKSDEADKVIVFERGPCLFVFNFHPSDSHTDYRVGHTWNEGLRVVLDTDEERFGGFKRLEYGHQNSLPPLDGWDNRYHSVKLYAPSRTAQVLVRDSLLQGGVTVYLDLASLAGAGQVQVQTIRADGKPGATVSPNADNAVTFPLSSGETFAVFFDQSLKSSDEVDKPKKAEAPEKQQLAGGPFKAYFPGSYLLTLGGIDGTAGMLSCLGDAGAKPSWLSAKGPPTTEATTAQEVSDLPGLATEVDADPAVEARTLGGVGSQSATATPANLSCISSAETVNQHNVPDNISIGLCRLASFSAFGDMLTEAAAKIALRKRQDERPDKYEARHVATSIVIVASELNPWSKTGGLAMVAGSYGYEFAMRGHRTMVVAPRYEDYGDMFHVGTAKLWMDGNDQMVEYWHQWQDYGDGKGCDYIFVDHPSFRRGASIYCQPNNGPEYGDNLFRFALLSLAATEAPLSIALGGAPYGEDVVFIANDWQTGLVPVYLHYKYKMRGVYANARSMFVIHNLGYQGKYSSTRFPVDQHLGLPPDAFAHCLKCRDINSGPDCLNLLCGAVTIADRVLTVSPNYAFEIQTSGGGYGMHEVLRGKADAMRLAGILNGISDEWSPSTDPALTMNYSSENFEEGKAQCKKALQRELGLDEDPDVVLLGFCGRLCSQKGIHLILDSLHWMMQDQGNGVNGRVQVLLMGKGDAAYSDRMTEAEVHHKGRICGYAGFDPNIEHRMMGGCDLLLMPSQYEPCGLPQMYAQQYGTLPIVHETGGLKDSVFGLWDQVADRAKATGFRFSPFTDSAFKERLYQAMAIFHHDRELFRTMQLNAMNCDYYWPKAIDEYERHVDWTLDGPPCW